MRLYAGKDFPRLSVWIGNPMPAASVTQRSTLSPGEASNWGEAPADLWLERARGSVCEQALGQKEGFRLTLLTFEAESADTEEDEEVERAWAPPAFRKR